VPKSKGGGDYFENYQLLCSSCNRTKGARPMEYLNNKIKMRQRLLDEKYTFGE
jgi:site-specific DNA-methyltransferase (adenine-specific)